MASKHAYDIAFVGLKLGPHVYEYSIDDKFFEAYDHNDFSGCKAKIKLTLDKQSTYIKLQFDVDGKAQVVCDRCSNDLEMQLWDEFSMFIKFADNADEMNDKEEDPDIFYISRTESIINVEKWLYEFVMLSVPAQRRCNEENMGGPQCNKEVLKYLQQSEENINKSKNPIWKGLEGLELDNN
jgi:uncharacterized metal-binding protein YceD (DUF177 family)